MLRPALWLLLFAALTGRVAAMPGWMPIAGAHGIEIMLCNGGTMTMEMPMHGKHGMPEKHSTNDCPYAAAAHAGGGLGEVTLVTAPGIVPRIAPIASLASIIAGRALALPPATGPPAFD
ncbi:hypothetical protein SPAN111604_07160 [Sphingomonas antarctica]|uniref:hypothetical protein n=1 Tax=Sphingomonas antarctica TaxID=2040274 RepID=UPI0039EBBAF3